jgi:competence protein ComEA
MNAKNLFMSIICAVIMIISVNHALGAEKAAEAQAASQPEAAVIAAEKIDINQADVSMLATLPGIGPKTAENIDSYRQANGPFKSLDDLLNVRGIGPAKLEKIKPLVTLS